MYDIQKATSHVASEIEALKVYAAGQYNHPAAALLLHRVNTTLDEMLNRLHFLAGTAPVIPANAEPMFKPLTEFMGEPINAPQPLKKEDLNPSDAERLIYVDKVKRLYEEIDTLATDAILNSYTIPEDVMVLRGVARLASKNSSRPVEDYEDRPIDEAFVEDILKAKAARIADAKEQAAIDRKLKEQDAQQKAPAPAATETVEPVGNKIEDPTVQATEATATEAKPFAAPGNPVEPVPNTKPAVGTGKTLTPAAPAAAQAKQQETNKNTKTPG
jgi:hypothetical protein